MKLASISVRGSIRTGIVDVDRSEVRILPQFAGTVDENVRRGDAILLYLAKIARQAPAIPFDEVDFLPPLSEFNRDVLCTGWNYVEHFEESRGKREGQDPTGMPNLPTFFTKAPSAIIGPYDDIAVDHEVSQKWDYEAEVGVVIGRTGRSIKSATAMDHIFGYLVANDVSQRDLQRAHGGQWFRGKSIDHSSPIGPWITTKDEIPAPYELQIECWVNGLQLQHASTAQIVFRFDELIERLSFGMTLHAGDLLLTGTPSGIGNAREPQVFLHDGDLVRTQVESLGELENHVIAQDLHSFSNR